jgi:hypothetical protein
VNRLVGQEAVKRRLTEMTMQVVTDSTPQSAAEFLRAEMAKWEPIIREAGIRVN